MRSEEIKEQSRALWREIFGDSEEFIDLYFNEKFDAHNTIYREYGGKIISSMQVLPYNISYIDDIVPAGYMSGIATRPEHRSLGLASGMLAEAHRMLYSRGALFSFLIPAEQQLFDYYSKHQYTLCSKRKRSLVDIPQGANSMQNIIVKEVVEPTSEILVYMNRHFDAHPMVVKHTERDIKTVFADLALTQSPILAAYRDNALIGVLITARKDGDIEILYAACSVTEVREVMLAKLSENLQGGNIYEYTTHMPQSTEGLPYAQIRLINVHEALSIWARSNPRGERLYMVEDPDIAENNRCFRIRRGVCRVQRGSKYIPTITIDRLTEELFDGSALMPSLMMD